MIFRIVGEIAAPKFRVGLEHELETIAKGNDRPGIQLCLVADAIVLRAGGVPAVLNRREHGDECEAAERSLHRRLAQNPAFERQTEDGVGISRSWLRGKL